MIDRIYFLLRISTTFKEMMEDDDAPGHFSIAYRNLLLSLLLVHSWMTELKTNINII